MIGMYIQTCFQQVNRETSILFSNYDTVSNFVGKNKRVPIGHVYTLFGLSLCDI